MTQEETDKVIAEAYYAASFVKNPFFELASGKKEEKVFAESRLLKKSCRGDRRRVRFGALCSGCERGCVHQYV